MELKHVEGKKARISFKQKQIQNKENKLPRVREIHGTEIKVRKQQVKQTIVQNKSPPKIFDQYPNAQSIKIVFLGDGNSGKTSALISYTSDIFNQDYVPTIFDTYESVIKKGQQTIKLQLWDTAGQDQYKKLRSLSYPKTDLFFICFSMIDRKSFSNATKKWYKQVKQNCPRAEIIFVGTKIDLRSQYLQNKKISQRNESDVANYQKIQKCISSLGHKLMTCSAMTQVGLPQLFDRGIQMVLQKRASKLGNTKKAQQFQCQLI